MFLKKFIPFILLTIFCLSCKGPISKIFKKQQTPHEAYAAKIKNDSLRKEWIRVSENSLPLSLPVSIPYQHKGNFPDHKLRALTFKFNAMKGERITIAVNNMGAGSGIIFTDLFKKDTSSIIHLIAADTNTGILNFDVEESAQFVLRLQPQITIIENYILQINRGPSLLFPVAGERKIWSVWGDARDAGARSHEGIDIGAPRGTPVIAATDGIISRVQESDIGGKTISIRSRQKNLGLYYAHLEKQLVTEGRQVSAGDTIGLVGNTGNAITTGPHLHFGIYTTGGAIDPIYFVNKNVKPLPAIPTTTIPKKLELVKSFIINDKEKLSAKTILIPLAISAEGYVVETPEGIIIKVPEKSVKQLKK